MGKEADSRGTLRRWCKERRTQAETQDGLPHSQDLGGKVLFVWQERVGERARGWALCSGEGQVSAPPPILKAEGWGGSVRVHREGRGLDLECPSSVPGESQACGPCCRRWALG